jgi:hypothetical protein
MTGRDCTSPCFCTVYVRLRGNLCTVCWCIWLGACIANCMLYVRQTNYQNVSQGVEREVEEVIRAYGKRMWVHLHKPTYTT